jgi:hypothetical protein
MGSSSNSGIISYPHQITTSPAANRGVGRNASPGLNTSPIITPGTTGGSGRNANLNRSESVRPVVSGRTSTPVQRGNTDTYQRSGNVTPNVNPGGNTNRTINNTNTTPARTSTPTIRSGGSSGGSVSSPGGGSRSGGRR